MSDHMMESEGPWPAGWLWSLVAAVAAAVLARWLGDVSIAASVLLGLMVFAVYCVLLAQFWEAPARGHQGHDDHGHGHSHNDHAPAAGMAPAVVAPVAAVVAAPVVAPVAVAAAPVAAVAVAEPVSAPAAVDSVAADATKPQGLAAPRGGVADALQEVEGIGPVLEKLCHELGIFHFDQIAGWGTGEIAWMDGNLKGFKGRVTRDRWVVQAKLIVAEGVEAFRIRAKTNNY